MQSLAVGKLADLLESGVFVLCKIRGRKKKKKKKTQMAFSHVESTDRCERKDLLKLSSLNMLC